VDVQGGCGTGEAGQEDCKHPKTLPVSPSNCSYEVMSYAAKRWGISLRVHTRPQAWVRRMHACPSLPHALSPLHPGQNKKRNCSAHTALPAEGHTRFFAHLQVALGIEDHRRCRSQQLAQRALPTTTGGWRATALLLQHCTGAWALRPGRAALPAAWRLATTAAARGLA